MRTARPLRVIALASVVAVLMTGCAPDRPAAAPKAGTVTIYLTRHGQTWFNTLGLVQGWSDTPLTQAGEQDATDDGKGFAARGVRFAAAYSADMVRHYQTATLILRAMGSSLTPVRVEGLREMAFGKFEGAPEKELQETLTQGGQHPASPAGGPAAYLAALDEVAKANAGSPLTAETTGQVRTRAVATLNSIAAQQARAGGGNVLVVSSGVTIMCVLSAFTTNLDAARAGIANGAVSVLKYQNGSWTVESVNDTSYLSAGGTK